jgi:hypothetical protein
MAPTRRGTAAGATNGGGTTIAIAVPTGVVSGDYIYVLSINYNGTATAATCAGYVNIASFSYLTSNATTGYLFRRVATGTGADAISVVWDSSSYLEAMVIAYSGVDSEVIGTGVGASGSTATFTGVTTTVDDSVILTFASGYGLGFSSPSGNELNNFDGVHSIYSTVQTTAGASGSLTPSLGGTDTYVGIRLALQPSASSPVSVNLTKQTMTVTNRAPTVDVGSSPTNVNLTKPTYTTTHRPPTVSIAATVNLTLATFTVTNRAISVQVSSTVNLTRQVMTITNRSPLVSYGASVNLARQIMSVTNRTPAIPLYLSRQIMTITNRAVGFSIGATVNLARQIITVTNRFVSVFIPGTGTPESQQRTRKRRRQ